MSVLVLLEQRGALKACALEAACKAGQIAKKAGLDLYGVFIGRALDNQAAQLAEARDHGGFGAEGGRPDVGLLPARGSAARAGPVRGRTEGHRARLDRQQLLHQRRRGTLREASNQSDF